MAEDGFISNADRRVHARTPCSELIWSREWCGLYEPVGAYADDYALSREVFDDIVALTYSVIEHFVTELVFSDLVLFSDPDYEDTLFEMRRRGRVTAETTLADDDLDPQWLQLPAGWSSAGHTPEKVRMGALLAVHKLLGEVWPDTEAAMITPSRVVASMVPPRAQSLARAIHATLEKFGRELVRKSGVVVMTEAAFVSLMRNAFMSGYIGYRAGEWAIGNPLLLLEKS